MKLTMCVQSMTEKKHLKGWRELQLEGHADDKESWTDTNRNADMAS